MTGAMPPMRRGWCPGVLTPMPTGDGLLARLHPPAGVLTAAQARAVAAAARACGNGCLDVTGRANLQIRGVRADTHVALVERLAAVGLVESAAPSPSPLRGGVGVALRSPMVEPDRTQGGHAGPIRLTVVSPLAGLDPTDLCDARALAEAIETEGRTIESLPVKTCVAVDGGGALPLDDVEADLRVVAVGPLAAPLLAIGLGEGPHWIGSTTLPAAPQAVRALLVGFTALLRSGQSEARRLKHLSPHQGADLAREAGLGPILVPPKRDAAPRAGVLPLADGRAALLAALPFGRCGADQLARAADWSERYGTGALHLSPWRGLALPGVAPADLAPLAAEARLAGLILDPADPRLMVLACPGRPACASATTDTHADAARLAAAARAAFGAGATVHVSGCPKGCAHPGAADLTLVGDDGAYRIAPGGAPRDAGPERFTLDAVLRRLADAPRDLLAEHAA